MEAPLHLVAIAFATAAIVGLAIGWIQLAALWKHVTGPRVVASHRPPISILKPLCGLDDSLAENLESFAALPYPDYEVVLGLRNASDPACRVARLAAQQSPGRFRVVVQEGEPGLNPKVNQLITLARRARHDILVISDSNTRVPPGYLDEIAGYLGDPTVGLVTHPLVGDGEEEHGGCFGSVADNLHLSGTVTPSFVAAKLVCGKDYVVGKSMAMRRSDIDALGGFASAKDVLAEDFVLGRAVTSQLKKRIVLGRGAVTCISVRRSLVGFVRRYARWSVMQRQCAGLPAYLGLLLENPVLLSTLAAIVEPTAMSAGLAWTCWAGRMATDALAGRLLRGRRFSLSTLLAGGPKDILAGAAWAYGLFSRTIEWRSNHLIVSRGSRLRMKTPRTRPQPDTGPVRAAA